jgi:hypothetical protein
MQDALPIVIVAVVGLAAIVAVLTLVLSKGAYDHIREGDLVPGPEPAELREEDLRQLRALLGRDAPEPVDDGLREEVRALVQARNARRVARGEPPLDVEAEVERRLSDLDG